MKHQLCLTTDFRADSGCPEGDLRAIADAGFTHVHWCHHWNTDFLYGPSEIAQIRAWLSEFGLQLLDLHGSAGREKCWWSTIAYQRLAGVELVENRLRMTAELGGASVVMHAPLLRAGAEKSAECDAVLRSLDTLAPLAQRLAVPLAIENMADDNFRFLTDLCRRYPADALGICYDSGHGNLGDRGGLDHLETLRHRLIAIHLHDNDGTGDQHRIPFTGSVEFPRLATILRDSAYRGCISMESNMNHTPEEQKASFLTDAVAAGRRLSEMVAAVPASPIA